jgi:hypothetical protein
MLMFDKTLTRLAPQRVFLLVALTGMILGGSLMSVTSAQASSPPTEVQTEAAEPTPGGFKLNGKLNPNGLPTTYYFNYNTGAECEEIEGCARETAVVGPLTGDTQQEVPPIEVTGLAPGQTYRYSLVAKNADGTVHGSLVTFATPPENHNGSGGQSPTQEPKSEPPLPLVTPLIAGRPAIGLPVETIRTRPLTNAQKLARALRVCEQKPKSKRAACEKQARVKYGVAIKNTGRRASRGKK